ncbi:helical backbone metal receptor [Porphyromonadaceae bacterium OttesenSCG-928-L07]|nr:helical backbone metal receptor [Porphyromonadaceae bacterium OttesenSCG-928-L07]
MEKGNVKVYVTIAILLFAAVATLLMGAGSYSSSGQNDGIIIDFGGYDTEWTSIDLSDDPDAMSALEYACGEKGYALAVSDGVVISIKGLPDGPSDRSWSLWVVEKGNTDWRKITSAPDDVAMSQYSAVAWALCSEDGSPTVPGVDQTGVNFYGHSDIRSIVTLAPSVTETACAVGGTNMIIGADLYSNYPSSIAEGISSGDIAVTGGFTNPNFEIVLKLDPDMVLCDGSQATHRTIANKLRNAGINVVVLYAGESIDTMYNNTYITGTALNFDIGKKVVIESIQNGIDEVISDMNQFIVYPKDMMISLSAVKSPWTSGSDTYINDISRTVYGVNVFSDLTGWQMVNSEMIIKASPEVIIVVSSEYSATEEDYNALIKSLSEGWNYIGAEVYLICESAADLTSRPGPRLAQVTELMGRILHGTSFTVDTNLPYYIGNDYANYLTFTKDLGFDR